MQTNTRPQEITVADLHADTEAIIENLSESGGAMIVSESGQPIAWLAPLSPTPDLTPEQLADIH